jgi:hypothetical protein
MLNTLISIFGFAKVAPKPLPKRPPTARTKPAAKAEPERPGPDLALRDAERARYAEDQVARAARAVHTIGAAAHVYAGHIAQVGARPSKIQLARAIEVLGPRIVAYFQALVLSDRHIPLMPLTLVGDEGREFGFAEGIGRDLKADLDLWSGIRARESRAADLAKRLDKPVAAPIQIPEDIQRRLLERDRLRADRVGSGGRSRVAPHPTPDPEAAAPLPEPERGSSGNRGGKRRDDEDEQNSPPVPPEGAEKNPDDDDDNNGPKR